MKTVKIRHKINNKITQLETPYKTITKEMIIADIIKTYPKTIKVMNKFKIHCVQCIMSQFETLEEGAKIHNLDPIKLTKALNKEIK